MDAVHRFPPPLPVESAPHGMASHRVPVGTPSAEPWQTDHARCVWSPCPSPLPSSGSSRHRTSPTVISCSMQALNRAEPGRPAMYCVRGGPIRCTDKSRVRGDHSNITPQQTDCSIHLPTTRCPVPSTSPAGCRDVLVLSNHPTIGWSASLKAHVRAEPINAPRTLSQGPNRTNRGPGSCWRTWSAREACHDVRMEGIQTSNPPSPSKPCYSICALPYL